MMHVLRPVRRPRAGVCAGAGLARVARISAAAAAVLAFALTGAAQATVSTVFTCPNSGIGGNSDYIFNGFLMQGLSANNLNTVTMYYTTDTDGLYTLTLTAHSGSFTGPQIGSTLSQMVTLSTSSLTQVTWNFGGIGITSGQTIGFVHGGSATGTVRFNLQPTLCPGDEETVGTSTTSNGYSVAAVITENTSTGGGGGCTTNNTTLCIDDRFAITTTFATSEGGGQSGNGHAIGLSGEGVTEGGLFWFFAANNPEMLIKVINGCALGGHFWVFYSAGTNVGFTVTVNDTQTGHQVKYQNPDLTAAPPVQDTSALPCP